MSRHDNLKAEWRPGQIWETLVEGCADWVPVSENGRAPPVWDERQEYRRRPEQEQRWKCGDEFLPFHPQASHVPPDYRDGWNRCYWAAVERGAKQDRQQDDGSWAP